MVLRIELDVYFSWLNVDTQRRQLNDEACITNAFNKSWTRLIVYKTV